MIAKHIFGFYIDASLSRSVGKNAFQPIICEDPPRYRRLAMHCELASIILSFNSDVEDNLVSIDYDRNVRNSD